MASYNIGVIPGDGIGPEVTREAVKVLKAVAAVEGFDCRLIEYRYSGHRELLGLALGCEESEESWSELLRELSDRGLHGVRLVIRDDHAGLRRAVRRFLPQAEQQRCWIHFLRNILAKVPQRLRKQVMAELKKIWKADSEEEARRRAQA